MKIVIKSSFSLLFIFGLCQVFLSCSSSVNEAGKEIELIDPVYPKKPKRQHQLTIHRDEDGYPKAYSMNLINSVCLDNKCKQVEVTMYWDDAGNYLRLEYPEENPLTKIEHEPFTPDDYERLDKILKDKKSILQKHSLAYLATEPDKEKNKKKPEKKSDEDVDGETKATPAAVKEAVVKDAAWTTWVLWTYANTEIVPILKAETESQITPAYLQKTLNSQNWQRIEFILNYLIKKKIYSKEHVDIISGVLAKANMEQIELALSYVKKSSRDKNDYFLSIIQTLPGMGNYNAALIIEELANEEKLDDEILFALTDTLDKVSYYAVHLSLRIIESKESFSEKIEGNISRLLDSNDFFVARRAYNFLKLQKLSSETSKKLADFAKKHEDRL